jgi:methyl-accepting chemotaxis protein WspA
MTHWTIRRRISVSFGVLLLLMAALAAVAYSRLVRINEQAEHVSTKSLPGLFYGAKAATALDLAYSLTQEFVVQRDPAARQKQVDLIAANRATLHDALTQYEETLTDIDRDMVRTINDQRDAFERIQDEILRANVDVGASEKGAVILGSRLDPAFDRTEALLQTLIERHRAAADADMRDILTAAITARRWLLISFSSVLILAFACGYYLLRSIAAPLAELSQRLEQSGLQVNTSVTEIAATARQEQIMATEVASTTLEIGATSKEISATAKELVRTMTAVSAAAEQSAALAGSGQTGLTDMEQAMRQVMAAAAAVNAKLAVLNEKAGNIGQVVTTITKVADQTNLLSLNAAIEAEKAGEYGRGFAVVATEIRRLADQTAVSTYDIEQMVKEIQGAVSAGVMSMDKFSEDVRRGIESIEQIGGQLSQIIQHAQALAPRVESVNEGMQAQTTGAEQISEALTQLSTAAQHTVESLRQSSAAIEGLQQMSSGLSADVSRFKAQVA